MKVSAPTPADDLRRIPGVGPSIAADLHRLGIARVADLRERDPQALYEELERLHGSHVDRCVLYVFREAVYFATAAAPDAELTKWWNWKDGGPAERRGLLAAPRGAA